MRSGKDETKVGRNSNPKRRQRLIVKRKCARSNALNQTCRQESATHERILRKSCKLRPGLGFIWGCWNRKHSLTARILAKLPTGIQTAFTLRNQCIIVFSFVLLFSGIKWRQYRIHLSRRFEHMKKETKFSSINWQAMLQTYGKNYIRHVSKVKKN